MSITLLNSSIELESFPISQTLKISSDKELEEQSLEDNVLLFRLQTENQLINLSEPYSYNLGYIKETFDVIDLSFKQTFDNDTQKYLIECKPKVYLNVDSTYCLYIDKKLSSDFLTITKNNSKSDSSIEVKLKDIFNLNSQVVLKILETSILKNNKNILKVDLDGRSITLDVRQDNRILSNNVEITLQDTIYVKGEEFIVDISPTSSVTDVDLQSYIHTVNSKTITPIKKEEESTRISNQDILNYYNNLSSNKSIEKKKSVPKYLDYNVFSIKIPEGYSLNTSKSILYTLTVAFNNYMLEKIKLYNPSLKYVCTVFLDDFDNELIFKVDYSKDMNQTETVLFDLTNIG